MSAFCCLTCSDRLRLNAAPPETPISAPLRLWHRLQAARGWPLVRRVLGWLYLLVVAVLLIALGLRLDWAAVLSSLGAIAPLSLLLACLLAAASHLAYSAFDLLGRAYSGHALSTARVLAITFVSYIGTLNFGALIGGIGVRQRLYLQAGLSLSVTAQVFALSVLTNWLGYLLLVAVLLIGPTYAALALPGLPSTALAGALGGAILVAIAGYLLACWWRAGVGFRLGVMSLRLPGLRLALGQVLVSAASWLINTAILYVLFGGQLSFDELLLVSMAAAVFGMISHIPASIGVLEGTFVALLSSQLAAESLIAVLLVYRAVFYLLPLPLAGLIWYRLETPQRAAPN